MALDISTARLVAGSHDDVDWVATSKIRLVQDVGFGDWFWAQ